MGLITGTSKLAQYILELFEDWKTDRKTKYETGWQANYDALTGTNGDFWKNNTWKTKEAKDWRSKAFPLVIKTKVLAGYSVVVDTVLQGGEIPFALLPGEGEDQPPELMEKKIKKQFVTAKADREMMKVVMSMALYSFGYVKSPIIKTFLIPGFQRVQNQPQLPPQLLGAQNAQGVQNNYIYQPVLNENTGPAIDYVSIWDIFRDWEHEDIQEGIGIIHRQMTSPYWLAKLKGKKYFLDGAIEKVIAEAQTSQYSSVEDSSLPPHLRTITKRKRTINRIEFWGRVPRKYLTEFEGFAQEKNYGTTNLNYDLAPNDQSDGDEVEIFATIANGDIVAITDNGEGERPFYGAKWEPMLDDIMGRSIADNLQDSQKMINGIVRAISDNAALLSNVILAMKPDKFENPSDELYPGLRLILDESCEDVRQAIQQVTLTDITGPLYNFFTLAKDFADENCNLPTLISGEVVDKKRETAFSVDARQQNAGKYIGQVIRNMDEGITEPIVQSFYRYNMLGEENQGKGNFTASATGFTSFQNRYIRFTKLQQMLTLSLSNQIVFQETKIRPLLEELYKMQDLEVDKFLKSEEDKRMDFMKSVQGVVMQIAQAFKLDPNQVMAVVQQTQQQGQGGKPGGNQPPGPAMPPQ